MNQERRDSFRIDLPAPSLTRHIIDNAIISVPGFISNQYLVTDETRLLFPRFVARRIGTQLSNSVFLYSMDYFDILITTDVATEDCSTMYEIKGSNSVLLLASVSATTGRLMLS